MELPELVNSYIKVCNYRKAYARTGTMDLVDLKWAYPTMLLIIGDILLELDKSKYTLPSDPLVRNYILAIIKETPTTPSTAIPIIIAPRAGISKDSQKIIEIASRNMPIEDKNSIGEALGELIDNIDQHSECEIYSFMAQRYPKRGFTEIAIFDNGITIPGSFRKVYGETDDIKAIKEAISGKSTKAGESRGYGLPTFIDVITKGFHGEVFIASGNGAYYANYKNEAVYKLTGRHERIAGTLVSMRIPIPERKVNLYDYTK